MVSFRTDYCTLPKNGNIFGTPILQSFLVKTNLSINLNFLPIVTSFTKMPKNKLSFRYNYCFKVQKYHKRK